MKLVKQIEDVTATLNGLIDDAERFNDTHAVLNDPNVEDAILYLFAVSDAVRDAIDAVKQRLGERCVDEMGEQFQSVRSDRVRFAKQFSSASPKYLVDSKDDKIHHTDFVKTTPPKTTPNTPAIDKHYKQHGELPPGITANPDRQTIYTMRAS